MNDLGAMLDAFAHYGRDAQAALQSRRIMGIRMIHRCHGHYTTEQAADGFPTEADRGRKRIALPSHPRQISDEEFRASVGATNSASSASAARR